MFKEMQFIGSKRRRASSSIMPARARWNSLRIKRNCKTRGWVMYASPIMLRVRDCAVHNFAYLPTGGRVVRAERVAIARDDRVVVRRLDVLVEGMACGHI